MAKKQEDGKLKRARTIAPPQWWMTEIRRALGTRTQEALLEPVRRRARSFVEADVLGPIGEIDQPRISNIFKGEHAAISLINIMSEVLSVPPPVYIPGSLLEARVLNSARIEYQRAAGILAGVDDLESRFQNEIKTMPTNPTKPRQTDTVKPPGGKSSKRG